MVRTRRPFGNIRLLSSGRYQARYTDPRTGAHIKAPNTFAGRNAAERWLGDRRRDIDAGLPPDRRPARLTFVAYSATWLGNRFVSGRPLKTRTREHYTAILERHLLPTFGRKPLAAITPQDVREWHAVTLTESPTMRAHAYSLLRTILNSAITDELIDSNPCRIAGAGRAARVHRIRPASLAELTTLTQAMPEPLQLMVLLASWCAMRFGEIIELRRTDVDLLDEVVRIRRAAYRAKGGYTTGTPKSDAGIRDVAIPPHLIPVIREHLQRFVGPQPDALLFARQHGRLMAPSTLKFHFYRARKAAGRPDLRFHDLRHTGAVLAAATGASLAELMARLGHSSASAALRYQHAAAGRDREIAALLSKMADT
jgi:integrase